MEGYYYCYEIFFINDPSEDVEIISVIFIFKEVKIGDVINILDQQIVNENLRILINLVLKVYAIN